MADEMKTGIEIIRRIIKEINKILKETINKVYLEGTNRVVDMPEFQNTDIAKDFLNVLNSKDVVSDVMNYEIDQDINVYIGEESEKEELKNFSLITFNHLIEGKDIGTIGIIGPTRMDYSKVISAMKFISKKLNEKSKNILDKGKETEDE